MKKREIKNKGRGRIKKFHLDNKKNKDKNNFKKNNINDIEVDRKMDIEQK